MKSLQDIESHQLQELLSQESIRDPREIRLELLCKLLPPALSFRQPVWIKVVAQKAFPAQAIEHLRQAMKDAEFIYT